MRVMILGGGSNQIDLIKKAKEMQDEVVLIDYLEDCPGKEFADVHLLISTFDKDAIIEAAREYKVDVIMTSGTDQPVLSAAIASDELGLKFYVDSATAEAVTNKIIMKDIFKRNNIPSVVYRLLKRDFDYEDIDGLKFPAVLKPVDSQGQRGVFLVESIEEVKDKIDETLSFSRQDLALLEEYYENDEITVNGWTRDGETCILSVVDRVTIKRDNHIGICLCHNFPSLHLKKYYDDIERITKQIVKAFNIRNGPIYFQYLVGQKGIKVNEIAMRIGGAYEGLTIPIIADVDILKMVLDYAKGMQIDEHSIKKYSLEDNKICLSTQLFFCNAGTISNMTPIEELEKKSCVKYVYYEYKVNDTIKPLVNATARAGCIIIEGTSFENMIENINMVFEKIEILDEKGNNLVIKYKDYNDKYLFCDRGDK